MRQIIQVQKARLFLLILINIVVLAGCNPGTSEEQAFTRTVEAALATEVSLQFTDMPTLTATTTPDLTATAFASVTATATVVPTLEPTITPTLWYRQLDSGDAISSKTRYGLVLEVPVVLYTSAAEAAVEGDRLRTLPGEEVYVSFANVEAIDGVEFAEVEDGGWIALEHIDELSPSAYAGVAVDEFPALGFGWTINPVTSLSQVPSEEEEGREIAEYDRYVVLEVLSVVTDEQRMRWFEIHPDEWISDEFFAYVDKAQANPTKGVTDRWISVNLSEQYLVVYDQDLPVYAALVSTGKETGWATGSGIFTVYHKDESYSLFTPDPNVVGNYLIQDVPHILYYQGSFAVHGAYWHDNFGLPNSHGCVNLSPTDAEWLFNWADEGEWVILYRN